MSKQTILTRTALLLALTLLFQSLRMIIPIPPLLSTFLIGALVNATLLVTLQAAGLLPAVFIACAAPLVAYLQQMLLLPVFIVPVAAGNIMYVGVFYLLASKNKAVVAGLAAVSKTAVLYFSFVWLLSWLNIPAKVANSLMFVMSWPQLATALLGAALALAVTRRLRQM